MCLHERAQYSSYGEQYVEYKKENRVIDFDDILIADLQRNDEI